MKDREALCIDFSSGSLGHGLSVGVGMALAVRILAHHAGITMGFCGSSHHATKDLSIMRSFAGLTVFGTVDPNLAEAALRASVSHPGPIDFRPGRGREKPAYARPPADFAFRILRELV